jgi:DNA-directed RNA polymerase subunit M/transcription elongation factor TFIIS
MSDFYAKRAILPDTYYSSQYNNIRRSHVIVIGCCLRNYEPFCALPMDIQESHIRKIERSCYNHTCLTADKKNVPRNWKNDNFQTLYNIITYKIQKNISYSKDDIGSEHLINRIINNEVDVDNIGKMKSNELRPEKTKDIYDDIEYRKSIEVVKKYSTQHVCFKCGGRKTTETEIQMRSLDEGSTIIITCEMENCSNVWKLSS